jgi:hypothetical protein
MKKQLLAASVLAIVQGAAYAAYPSASEQSGPYPSAGEETYALPAPATTYQPWGVSKRMVQPGSPFPSGGGYIDD